MESLLDLLQELGIPYRQAGEDKHTTAGWLNLECPFCGQGSGKFHLGIHLESGSVSCWTCGSHRLGDTLSELTGQPLRDTIPLSNRLFTSRTTSGYSGKGRGIGIDPRANSGGSRPCQTPAGMGDLLPIHRNYLRDRKFKAIDELQRLWGLKGIGLVARLAWRIVIPIIHRGKMVSWTTRAVSEEASPKYISARPEEEAMPAKSTVLGIDMVRHSVAIVEGPLDAIKIGIGAVATMGVVYSRAQVLALSRIPCRTVIFDSEPKAQERAAKLCSELECFVGRTIRVEIDAADPGSASDKEIRLIRKCFLD